MFHTFVTFKTCCCTSTFLGLCCEGVRQKAAAGDDPSKTCMELAPIAGSHRNTRVLAPSPDLPRSHGAKCKVLRSSAFSP